MCVNQCNNDQCCDWGRVACWSSPISQIGSNTHITAMQPASDLYKRGWNSTDSSVTISYSTKLASLLRTCKSRWFTSSIVSQMVFKPNWALTSQRHCEEYLKIANFTQPLQDYLFTKFTWAIVIDQVCTYEKIEYWNKDLALKPRIQSLLYSE